MYEVEYCNDITIRDGTVTLAVFQVVAVESNTPAVALNVAMGQYIELSDIGDKAEATIVQHYQSQLASGERQIIVIELQAFPHIQAHIDSRDQCKVNSDEGEDRFSKSIVELWQNYDQTNELPLIITHADTMSCILKRHTLATGKSTLIGSV